MSETRRVKIVAVESVPRLGFQAHFGLIYEALSAFGIQMNWGMGAFWDQTMQNAILETLENGRWDWVLTVDYDSLFTKRHLADLIQHAVSDDRIDALAAAQSARETDRALCYFGGNGTVRARAGEPIQCDSAHFGLTLIRVDKLRRLPLPWFQGAPNEAGRYDDGKCDPDIYFWREWKAAGNTCFMDLGVRIGHLVDMVKVHNERMEVELLTVKEWKNREAERDAGIALGVHSEVSGS